METKTHIPPRWLLLALLAGSLPALIGWAFGDGVVKSWDLPLGAAVLLGGVLLTRQKGIPVDGSLAIRAPLLLAFLVLLAPTLTVLATLPAPISNDEVSYLRQAEIFASGHLHEAMPAQPLVAFAERQRQVHEDPERGIRYSKYPPGTAAALTPGVWIGWPALMVALAGVLDLLLIWRLAVRLALPRPAQAAMLLALCPFFLLVQSSYQSEVFTLPAVLAAQLALLRAREACSTTAAFAWGGGTAPPPAGFFSVDP